MVAGIRRQITVLSCLASWALILVLMVPRTGAAQVLYGSVVGDVVDATGAALPGANVVITNNGTGLTRETVTDAAGHFNFPSVPAGWTAAYSSTEKLRACYTVSASASPRASMTLVLVEGARRSGHASTIRPVERTTSA